MPCVRATLSALALVFATIAGCTGNGVGLDQNGEPIGSGGAKEPLTADLKSIQDNIFTPICTRCHIGAGAPEGLRLDAADSFNLLVGVPSAEDPSVLRVMPGNPDDSYLIRKLQGSAGIVGVRMPFGGPYLPQATIDVIRQWITNGAAKADALTGALKAELFTVTGTAPMDGATVTQAVAQILIAFSHEVDASLVNDTTVRVERLAGGNFSANATAPARGIGISAQVVSANPDVILLRTRNALAPGTYRVSVRGAGAAALADLNAIPLAADYSFVFTVASPE